jgi:glycosyltransferase involved in cell wall biosynthesis
MRALMLSTVPTDPMDAGNRARVAALAKGIRSLGVDLHFVHVHTEHYDGAAMARRFAADRLHHLPFVPLPPRLRPWPRVRRALGKRLGVESAWLWGVDDWYEPRISETLRTLDARHAFDVAIVEYVWMSKALEAFGPRCLRLLDTHDRFGMRHLDYLKVGIRPLGFSTTLAEEERGLRRADAVLAIQPEEAEQFRKRLRPSPAVVQVGHLIEATDPPPLAQRPAAVCLASDNPINVHGVEWFLGEVMPRLKMPNFELVLAGTIGNAVRDQPRVRKLGVVPHVRDAFASGCVAVNPVRMGTGVNIKMLDALSCGIPTVASRWAARGLDGIADGFLTVSRDDGTAFADALQALLGDEGARIALRQRALAAAKAWNEQQMRGLATLFARDDVCRS